MRTLKAKAHQDQLRTHSAPSCSSFSFNPHPIHHEIDLKPIDQCTFNLFSTMSITGRPPSAILSPTKTTIDPSLPPWMRGLLQNNVAFSSHSSRNRRISSSNSSNYRKSPSSTSTSPLLGDDSLKHGAVLQGKGKFEFNSAPSSSTASKWPRGVASQPIATPGGVASQSVTPDSGIASISNSQKSGKVVISSTRVMGEESQGAPVITPQTKANDPALAHCPGIVERLRSKFSGLNLGDSDAKDPDVSSSDWSKPVRRVASLEDLLDRDTEDEVFVQSKGQTQATNPDVPHKGIFTRNISKTSQPSRYTSDLYSHNDALKRARSMESLSTLTDNLPSRIRPKKAVKDEFDYMVIIEHSSRPAAKKPHHDDANGGSRVPDLSKLRLGIGGDSAGSGGPGTIGRWNSSVDLEDELPRPDTVKNYKLMFESSGPLFINLKKAARRFHDHYEAKHHNGMENVIQKNNNLNASSVPLSTANKPKPPVPSTAKPLLVKPVGLPRPQPNPPVPKEVPQPAEDQVDITAVMRLSAKMPSVTKSPSPTPSPQPQVNGLVKPVLKRVSDHDLSIEDLEESKILESEMAKKPKVVSVHPKVEEDPQKTTLQSKGTVLPGSRAMTNGVDVANAPLVVLKRRGGPMVRPLPSNTPNSLTFNFVGTNVVPQVANTAPRFPVLRPGKVTINGVTEDAFDDFEDLVDLGGPPTGPCKYEFTGANVIISRSSLLKKRNKQLRIVFDDSSVSTYEYPSELLMEQLLHQETTEMDEVNTNGPQSLQQNLQQVPISQSSLKNARSPLSGGLANYTPSTLTDGEVFQLGISRHTPIPAASANKDQLSVEKEEPMLDGEDDVIIKPADAEENMTWSSAGTSDLLF